jgi:hypothetical protein
MDFNWSWQNNKTKAPTPLKGICHKPEALLNQILSGSVPGGSFNRRSRVQKNGNQNLQLKAAVRDGNFTGKDQE